MLVNRAKSDDRRLVHVHAIKQRSHGQGWYCSKEKNQSPQTPASQRLAEAWNKRAYLMKQCLQGPDTSSKISDHTVPYSQLLGTINKCMAKSSEYCNRNPAVASDCRQLKASAKPRVAHSKLCVGVSNCI